MRRLVAVLLLSACAPTTGPSATIDDLAPGSEQPPADASTVTVDRVLDGDSLRVGGDDEAFEIRLFGINAPEADECGGEAARDALDELVDAAVAYVDVDLDQYGRVIGLVWSSGTPVNRQLVRTGNAVTVTGVGGNGLTGVLDSLIAAQEAAMADGVGLWAETACEATTPRPAVAVTISSPNPPGPDDEVLNSEFVTVTNRGDADLELDGWILRDESTTNRYRFPPGTRLRAGDSVDIVTGCEATDGALAWCSERSVWSNGGDSAFLLDSFGRIVATDRYRP